jgi:integral membrane sensor domain MASE1
MRPLRIFVAAVTVAAFVLGIIGSVLSASALGWNVVQFRMQGARAKLTPVAGVVTSGRSGPCRRHE